MPVGAGAGSHIRLHGLHPVHMLGGQARLPMHSREIHSFKVWACLPVSCLTRVQLLLDVEVGFTSGRGGEGKTRKEGEKSRFPLFFLGSSRVGFELSISVQNCPLDVKSAGGGKAGRVETTPP